MTEHTRLNVRCTTDQKARWTEAAGGPGKMSDWVKDVLDLAASGKVPLESLETMFFDALTHRWETDDTIPEGTRFEDWAPSQMNEFWAKLFTRPTTNVTVDGDKLEDGALVRGAGGQMFRVYAVEQGEDVDDDTTREAVPPVEGPSPVEEEPLASERPTPAGGSSSTGRKYPGTDFPVSAEDAALLAKRLEATDAHLAALERGEPVFLERTQEAKLDHYADPPPVESDTFKEEWKYDSDDPTSEQMIRDAWDGDDTNPEIEDPDEPVGEYIYEMKHEVHQELPKVLPYQPLPTIPPVTHSPADAGAAGDSAKPGPHPAQRLSPDCTHAIDHWKLIAGEQCRYCRGVA